MPQNRVLNETARQGRAQPNYKAKNCLFCSASFQPYHVNKSKFCSVKCKQKARPKAPKSEKVCFTCGVVFIPKASMKAIHCSATCNSKASKERGKTDKDRNQKRLDCSKAYSKTEIFRLNQNNAKARRRAAERIGRVSFSEWASLKSKFGNACAYCRIAAKLTMDHVVPLAKGGPHNARNVVPSCQPCNSEKSTNDWTHKLALDAEGLGFLPAFAT